MPSIYTHKQTLQPRQVREGQYERQRSSSKSERQFYISFSLHFCNQKHDTVKLRGLRETRWKPCAYIGNKGLKVALDKRRGEQKTGKRDVRGVNVGLLSLGQADGLAAHQRHSTWKEKIWVISLFATEEVCTNETIICVLNHQTLLPLLSRNLSIPPAVCLSFQLLLPVHSTSPASAVPLFPATPFSLCVNLFLFFLCVSLLLSQVFALPLAPNPLLCSFVGGMRCFNESVLRPH